MEDLIEFPFNGEVASVSSSNETLAIKNPKFKKIHGRIFLTGTVPKGATINNWAEGCECAICWEDTHDLIVFTTEGQYAESIKRSS